MQFTHEISPSILGGLLFCSQELKEEGLIKAFRADKF